MTDILYEHLVKPDSCKSDSTEEANAPRVDRSNPTIGQRRSIPIAPITSPTEYSFQSGAVPATPECWREPSPFEYQTRPSILQQAREEEQTPQIQRWGQAPQRSKPVAIPHPNCYPDRCGYPFYSSCLGVPTNSTNLKYYDPLYYYKEVKKEKRENIVQVAIRKIKEKINHNRI